MTRPVGWYWVRRTSDEPWQPAWWGPCIYYPGEHRWRFANYLEIHRGRLYRVGPRIRPPK